MTSSSVSDALAGSRWETRGLSLARLRGATRISTVCGLMTRKVSGVSASRAFRALLGKKQPCRAGAARPYVISEKKTTCIPVCFAKSCSAAVRRPLLESQRANSCSDAALVVAAAAAVGRLGSVAKVVASVANSVRAGAGCHGRKRAGSQLRDGGCGKKGIGCRGANPRRVGRRSVR